MQTKQPILAILAIFLLTVATPMAFAEVKIGVVDVQSAILQSEEAKRIMKQIQDEFKDDQERLKKIQEEGTAILERLRKDEEVMSAAEKRRLSLEVEDKNNDLQYQGNRLQKQIQERRNELFAGIDAKVQKAIEELVLSEDYDIIIPRQTVLYVGELYKITRKVTEKLNEMDKKKN